MKVFFLVIALMFIQMTTMAQVDVVAHCNYLQQTDTKACMSSDVCGAIKESATGYCTSFEPENARRCAILSTYPDICNSNSVLGCRFVTEVKIKCVPKR